MFFLAENKKGDSSSPGAFPPAAGGGGDSVECKIEPEDQQGNKVKADSETRGACERVRIG